MIRSCKARPLPFSIHPARELNIILWGEKTSTPFSHSPQGAAIATKLPTGLRPTHGLDDQPIRCIASMGRDSVVEVDVVDAVVWSTFWRFANPFGPTIPNSEFFVIELPVGTIYD